MNNYLYQPTVTDEFRSNIGAPHRVVDPQRLEQFKSYIESHVASLTTELQTLKQHANWIEPRLNDYHKFNQWMEQAHPDIIEAYKKSTAVAEKLDRADDGEMAYAQVMP